MAVPHRSRSAPRGLGLAESKQNDAVVASSALPNERTKSFASDRPKTADARSSRSFSRPRTANAAVRASSIEIPAPMEVIQFRSGNDTYNFPTPSPRLPPKSATFHHPPNLPQCPPSGSPSIGVALGSPSHPPMPKWGLSYTTNDVQVRDTITPPQQRGARSTPQPKEVLQEKPGLKRKKSGWRALGDLFGRKPSKSAVQEPFYKVKVPHEKVEVAKPRDTGSPLPADVSASKAQDQDPSPTLTRGMARFEARAEADLASFHRENQPKRIMRSPSVIQKEGFSPMFRVLNAQQQSEEMFQASCGRVVEVAE